MRLPATGFAGMIFVLSVGLPLLTLALSTVMKMPAQFTLDNFTLDYWIGTNLLTVALQTGILLSPELWAAAKNTMIDRPCRRSHRYPRSARWLCRHPRRFVPCRSISTGDVHPISCRASPSPLPISRCLRCHAALCRRSMAP